MAEWFVKIAETETDEEVLGPLRPSDLLKMVRAGEVVRETEIRKDDSAWFPAGKVGGLFEAAIRPTITYFCPQCDTQVTEPPVTCPKCLRDIRKAREEIVENTIGSTDEQSYSTQAGRSVQNWLNKKVRRKDSGKKNDP